EAPWTEAGCDMDWVLKDLAKRGVLQVMVEGGGRLHSSLLKHDLADQMVVYIGGKILGDQGAPAFAGLGIQTMTDTMDLRLIGAKQLGNDMRLDYERIRQGDQR
ncbi:MAG: RibD family protein, partial [Chlamydiia bacterium]|nr:RibD family protein [Chlamydiia bacterium]